MPPIPIPMPSMRVRFAKAGSKRNSKSAPVAAPPAPPPAARAKPSDKMTEYSSEGANDTFKAPSSRSESGWSGRTFPFVLHDILSREEYKQYITWMPYGKAWRILDMPNFAEVVCPKFFRHSNHRSFMQNVRNWDFNQLVDDDGRIAYHHDLFTKQDPTKCRGMRRVNKQTKLSNSSSSAIKKDDLKDATDGIVHLNTPKHHRPPSSSNVVVTSPNPMMSVDATTHQHPVVAATASTNLHIPPNDVQRHSNPLVVRTHTQNHRPVLPMQLDQQQKHIHDPPGTRIYYTGSSSNANPPDKKMSYLSNANPANKKMAYSNRNHHPISHYMNPGGAQMTHKSPPSGPMTRHPQNHYSRTAAVPPCSYNNSHKASAQRQQQQQQQQAQQLSPPPQQHIIVHHHHHPVVIQQQQQNDSVYSLIIDDNERKKKAASRIIMPVPNNNIDPMQIGQIKLEDDAAADQRTIIARIPAQRKEEQASLELLARRQAGSRIANSSSYTTQHGHHAQHQPQTIIHEVHHHHAPQQQQPQNPSNNLQTHRPPISSFGGYSVDQQTRILAEIQTKRADDKVSLALARSLQCSRQRGHVPPSGFIGVVENHKVGPNSNGNMVMDDSSSRGTHWR